MIHFQRFKFCRLSKRFNFEAQLEEACKHFKKLVPTMMGFQTLGSACSVFLFLPGSLEYMSGRDWDMMALDYGRRAQEIKQQGGESAKIRIKIEIIAVGITTDRSRITADCKTTIRYECRIHIDANWSVRIVFIY